MFKIDKTLKTECVNYNEIKTSIELKFSYKRFTFIFNSDELLSMDWTSLLKGGGIVMPLGRNINNYGVGKVNIFKENDLLCFDIDTEIGIAYKISIQFSEAKKEIEELCNWYEKLLPTFKN